MMSRSIISCISLQVWYQLQVEYIQVWYQVTSSIFKYDIKLLQVFQVWCLEVNINHIIKYHITSGMMSTSSISSMMFRSQHQILTSNMMSIISSSIISLQVWCQVQVGTILFFQVKYPTSSKMFEHFSFPSSINSDLMPILEPIQFLLSIIHQ